MNIYDISQKAGVSIATVSRVLNNNKNVSEKTRLKVLAVMKEEDYQPNAFARGLTLNTMKTVGLLCADSSDPYLGSAISYLEQGLRAHSYDSLLCCTGYEQSQKEKCLDMLLSRHVDALVLIGSNFIERNTGKNEYLYRAASQVPVLILNGLLKGENIYSSLCDDTEAVCNAATRLLKSGCKTPLFLYRADSFSGTKKKEGFLKALELEEMDWSKDQIVMSSGSIRDVQSLLLDIHKKLPFDAVLASDDELAIGALKFAKTAGLSIPDDLSIVGYNNSMLSICCDPELTSIDNRLEYLCNTSVSLLMNLLNGKTAPDKTVVSADIVIRDTTRKDF
ncbi:MAG TPA: LacI family DNA-binding transcriptional regulator [Candidatus Pelethocola excrementipullorum]|nr:LacI family DNA-binding transcriptional regulator [Candidatus Pelethocola excrementipullorum]